MPMTLTQRLQPLAAPILWLHRRLLPQDSFVGWTPYLWLVWVGFFFIPWGLQPINVTTKIATAVALAVFLLLYFRYYWARGAERWWIIGIIAALGCALTPFNGAGGGLLIYAGAFAGYTFRPRLAVATLAALTVAAIGEYIALGFPLFQWIWAPVVIVMIGFANLWSAEQKRQHYALRRSQDEVKRLAATAERERIGRDLHDLLGHTLTLITVKAELAAKLADRDMIGAAREIREVERVSREALQQVREAVGGYRKGGFTGELANARAALTAADIGLTEKTDSYVLSDVQDSLLAMVLREAVTNIVRHSGAGHCRIELEGRDRDIRLLVEDDGRGGEVHEGNGLKGMRERLREVSGRLDIASGREGTRLAILVPANGQKASNENPTLSAQSA
ncbi:MAG: sensor histidine kinase [Gammaproteobacteria bacterium]